MKRGCRYCRTCMNRSEEDETRDDLYTVRLEADEG